MAASSMREDGPVKTCVVVCLKKQPRVIGYGIRLVPWRQFPMKSGREILCQAQYRPGTRSSPPDEMKQDKR